MPAPSPLPYQNGQKPPRPVRKLIKKRPPGYLHAKVEFDSTEFITLGDEPWLDVHFTDLDLHQDYGLPKLRESWSAALELELDRLIKKNRKSGISTKPSASSSRPTERTVTPALTPTQTDFTTDFEAISMSEFLEWNRIVLANQQAAARAAVGTHYGPRSAWRDSTSISSLGNPLYSPNAIPNKRPFGPESVLSFSTSMIVSESYAPSTLSSKPSRHLSTRPRTTSRQSPIPFARTPTGLPSP